jgi:DNA gyrase subunit A
MPITTFREQRRGGHGIIGMDMKKESDMLKSIYVASTHDHIMIFTSFGRVYWLKAWQIPETGRRSKGRPLVNLLEGLQPEEKVAALLKVDSFDKEACVLLTTLKGIVKKTELSAFSNPRRKGVYAINIDENDELISARIVQEDQQIMIFTRSGMAVRFNASSVRSIGRVARGVKGVSLKNEKDKVVACEVVTPEDSILVVCENGYGKRSKVNGFRQTNRGGIGVRSIITSVRNGFVVGAISVSDEEGAFFMSNSGQTIRINMKDVRVMGRSTQGVRLVHLKAGDQVVGIQKIETVIEPEIQKA